jgi:hypothetical protein
MELLVEELREVRLEMGSLSLALAEVLNRSTSTPSELESTEKFVSPLSMTKPMEVGPSALSFGVFANFWLTGVVLVALFGLMLRQKFRPITVSYRVAQYIFFFVRVLLCDDTKSV